MQFITNYKVENFILNSTWEDFPDDVKKRAIVCSIDLVTALALGCRGRQHAAGKHLAQTITGYGTIPIFGSRETFSFLGAVIALGHAANSFDIDDGYNMIKGHPGASFIAGLLAAALEKNISYKEYLTALVVSYETTIRCGLAMQQNYNFLNGSGSYGAFGTAAAIGRIYNLTKEQLNTALSIAEFHAPMTPVMRSVEYPSMNKDGIPFGSFIGAMAVLETLSGVTGKGYLLETPELNHPAQNLGSEYEILNLYFKPYTSCRWTHQPIRACLDLQSRYNFMWESIKKVIVHTFDSAAKLSKIVPVTTDDAQYNIAYPIACALVHGDVGYKQVIEEALSDSRVIHVMKLIEFYVDPDIEAKFPAKRLSKVEIWLENGIVHQSDIFEAEGEASDNIDIKWINAKFKKHTKFMLSEENQNKILQILSGSLDIPMPEILKCINSGIEESNK